jgi:hypothetical protein
MSRFYEALKLERRCKVTNVHALILHPNWQLLITNHYVRLLGHKPELLPVANHVCISWVILRRLCAKFFRIMENGSIPM